MRWRKNYLSMLLCSLANAKNLHSVEKLRLLKGFASELKVSQGNTKYYITHLESVYLLFLLPSHFLNYV